MGVRLKQLPHHDAIRKVRETAPCWLHCFSLRPGQYHVKSLSLCFLSGKRKSPDDNQTPSIVETLLVTSPDWELQETLWASTTRNLTVTEKNRMACNNQYTDLGRPSSYLQRPSTDPSHQLGPSAEPSERNTLTRESGGMQLCLIHIFKWRALPVLEPHQINKLSQSPTHWGESCLAMSDLWGWQEHLKAEWQVDGADHPLSKGSTRSGDFLC